MLEERHRAARPTTMLGAQYSLPWSTALALCRDVSDPTSWTETDLMNPEITRVADLVEIEEDRARFGSPGKPLAEVSLKIAGASHSFLATDWKGAPSNPYTYTDVGEKFARYAAPYLTPSRTDEIVDRVASLEKEADIAGFAAAIRTDNG
jgi:2-methylcitrate dehydratase PrpD